MRPVDSRDAFLPHVLVNRSVCLDKLGRLDEAVDCQHEALSLSRERGLQFGELVCLENLAATESRRGNFEDAQKVFVEAERLSSDMRNSREGDIRSTIPVLAADHAYLQLEMGKYAAALQLVAFGLRELKGPRGGWTGVLIALEAAEVYGRIGQSQRALKFIQDVYTSELLQSDFLRVRRAIALAGSDRVPFHEQLDTLTTALQLTFTLGTLYQRTRVLIALTALHIEMDERDNADEALQEARTLSKQCSLGALRPRIALLQGKLAENDRNKLRYLVAAHRMAKRLPLPEITAEAGFLIARIKFAGGSTVDAHRYLHKSVQISLNLAGQIPTRARNSYLKIAWRKEAREMLRLVEEQANSEEMVRSADRRGAESYFKAVYELTVALGKADNVNEFTEVLQGSMSRILKRGFIIYLTARDKEESFESQITYDSKVSSPLCQRG
jgi:hypothetical protein